MLFTSDGFVTARKQDAGRSDIYVFGYGSDHREALRAFYTVSGKAPVIPRWAFGNWWSRFCKSFVPSNGVALLIGRCIHRHRVYRAYGSVQGGEDTAHSGSHRYGLVCHLDSSIQKSVSSHSRHLVDVPPEEGAGWTGYT
jgi:hypothetical protein